jgi:hypothetical protein
MFSFLAAWSMTVKLSQVECFRLTHSHQTQVWVGASPKTGFRRNDKPYGLRDSKHLGVSTQALHLSHENSFYDLMSPMVTSQWHTVTTVLCVNR